MAYLLKREHGLAKEEADMEFKNLVFANNPKLYRKLFGATNENRAKLEDQVQWVRPQTAAEVAQALGSLREISGLDLQIDPTEDNDWSRLKNLKFKDEDEEESGELEDPMGALSATESSADPNTEGQELDEPLIP